MRKLIPLFLSLCLLLTACGSGGTTAPDDQGGHEQAGESSSGQNDTAPSGEMFTQRDLRTTYAEGSAALITLDGSSAQCIYK